MLLCYDLIAGLRRKNYNLLRIFPIKNLLKTKLTILLTILTKCHVNCVCVCAHAHTRKWWSLIFFAVYTIGIKTVHKDKVCLESLLSKSRKVCSHAHNFMYNKTVLCIWLMIILLFYDCYNNFRHSAYINIL